MKKMMAPHETREIVIEFEKVQMIRKRARTTYKHCHGCGEEADFVALAAAARLFDMADSDLAAFVAANSVHTQTDAGICVPSLLAVMHERTLGNGVKMIESEISS